MRIGQASSSEFYSKWGVAGRQRAGELEIKEWYAYNWKSVYRPKDKRVAEIIAKTMEDAIANNHVGYSQNNGDSPRTTLFEYARAKMWDVSAVDRDCNTDCSALVSVCCNAAGIPVSKDMSTYTEESALEATECFEKLTDSKYLERGEYLERGDILFTIGHTCVALDDGLSGHSETYMATGNVWMRTEPNTSAPTILAIPKGAYVEVYAVEKNGWMYGAYNGKEGYISGKWLKQVYTDMTITNCKSIRLREGAGVTYKTLTVLMAGAKVKWTGYEGTNGWREVYYMGQKGFVKKNYLI